MSRLRPAMSAPRRPTKATSPPSAAIQAATLSPEPPPCMVTLAGVPLPRASASRAWATVSVIRSPMTTTRAILGPHLAVLIWADSPPDPCPLRTTSYGIGQQPPLTSAQADITSRIGTEHAAAAPIVTGLLSSPGGLSGRQRDDPAGHHQFRLLRLGGQRLVEPPELVAEQPPGRRPGHHAQPGLVADRHHVGFGLPPRAGQPGHPDRQPGRRF